MGDNRLGLIFDINANSSKAETSMKEIGALSQAEADALVKANERIAGSYATLAEALKSQGYLQREVGKAYRAAGISADDAARHISAAFGAPAQEQLARTTDAASRLDAIYKELGIDTNQWRYAMERAAAAQQSSTQTPAESEAEYLALTEKVTAETREQNVLLRTGNRTAADYAENYGKISAESEKMAAPSGGLYRSLSAMRHFRAVFSATLGLAAFGFWITEWGRVAEAIKNAAVDLGGFDAGLRQVMADTAAMNEKLLSDFRRLSIRQEEQLATIKDQTQRGRERLELEVQAASSQHAQLAERRQYLDHELRVMREIKALYPRVLGEESGFDLVGLATTASRSRSLYAEAKRNGFDLSQSIEAVSKQQKKAYEDEQNAGYALVRLKEQLADASTKQGTADEHAARRAQTAENRYWAQQTRLAAAAMRQENEREAADRKMFARRAAEAQRELHDAAHLERAWQSVLNAQERARQHAGREAEQGGSLERSTTRFLPGMPPALTGIDQILVPKLGATRQALLSLNDALTGTNTSFQHFSGEAGIALEASDRFSQGMASAVTQAIVYGDNVAKAMRRAAQAELERIATTSAVRAIEATAIGFYDLATWNFAGATAAFESAALFGALAAGTAAAGAAIGGRAATRGEIGSGGLRARTGYQESGAGRSSGLHDVAGSNLPPRETYGNLAAGAPGGQVTVLVGSNNADLAAYVGGLVNAHVANGGYVEATTSQRGAPVGH
jgi:hypothetical protein